MSSLALSSTPRRALCPRCDEGIGGADLVCLACAAPLVTDLLVLEPVADPRARYLVARTLLDRELVQATYAQVAFVLENGGTLARGLPRSLAEELLDWLLAEGLVVELVDPALRASSGVHARGREPVRISSIPPSAVPHDPTAYAASGSRRLVASLVDLSVLAVQIAGFVLLARGFAAVDPHDEWRRLAFGLACFAWLVGLSAFAVSELVSLVGRGQTIGQRWASIRRVRLDGSLPHRLRHLAEGIVVVDLRRMPPEALDRSLRLVPD
ncbi:MAG: RDD family protein [Polyangiales bacterium]